MFGWLRVYEARRLARLDRELRYAKAELKREQSLLATVTRMNPDDFGTYNFGMSGRTRTSLEVLEESRERVARNVRALEAKVKRLERWLR